MNSQPDPPALVCHETPQQKHRFASMLLRSILAVCSITLLVLILFFSLGMIRLSQSITHILAAFIYSAAISVPSIFLLNWIGLRFTERYPRLVVLMNVGALVSMAVTGTFAASLVIQFTGIIPHFNSRAEFRGTLPFAILISLMIGLSTSTYETLRYKLQATSLELRTRQVEQERAYKLLAEAQLSSLESRIHPHFLFNTLNSIAALIPSDPARAEDTVGKLASLLRFSLNAHHSGLVPLSQELKIVRDYLEIEKTRFGSRIRYDISVPTSLDAVKVPPLALQSLVENTVKHVVARRTEGADLQITGANDAGRIHIEVIDDGPGFSLDAITPEHGLGNLIARLELLYGPAGQLEVKRENERTVVRIAFPA